MTEHEPAESAADSADAEIKSICVRSDTDASSKCSGVRGNAERNAERVDATSRNRFERIGASTICSPGANKNIRKQAGR